MSQTIDKYLAGYAPRQIEDAAAVLRTLARKGIAPDAFVAWAAAREEEKRRALVELEEARAKRRRLIEAVRRHAPRCPDCARPMTLHGGDDNDGQWVCKAGRRSQYGPHPPETELRRIGVKEI